MNIRSTYLPRKYSLSACGNLLGGKLFVSRDWSMVFLFYICKYFIFVSDMGRCHDKFVMLYVSRYQSPSGKFVSIFFQIDEEFTLRINLLSSLDERNASKMHRKWILSPFRKVSKYYQNISQLKNSNLSEIQIFFQEREREREGGKTRHSIFIRFQTRLKKIVTTFPNGISYDRSNFNLLFKIFQKSKCWRREESKGKATVEKRKFVIES